MRTRRGEQSREASPSSPAADDSTKPVDRDARAALACFVALAIVAFVFFLVLGRKEWFFLDEWDFLADRTAFSWGDLMRPHNQHWTTLPILSWRALWPIVGLRSYLPYEALGLLGHIAVAALGRAVMRRAGVAPWVATIAAGAFLFFGSGAENILYAFQIMFTGALAFGLAYLLLADHDGPFDRRDWFGLGAGLCALMCSGVGVAMVVMVGVAVAVRRGWRVAAMHVVPLAAIYVAWWLRYGRSSTHVEISIRSFATFVRSGLQSAVGAVVPVFGVGVVLFVVLVAGLTLRWKSDDTNTRAARLASSFGLLAGAVAFFAITASGRASTGLTSVPNASRYLYNAVALVLPVLGIAIDAVLRRSRAFGSIALVLLLVGVPGNIAKATDFAHGQAIISGGPRRLVRSIGRMPLSREVPGSLRPEPAIGGGVTMEWILAGVKAGRIPALRDPSRQLLASNRLRLSLMELDTKTNRRCVPLSTPVVRHLDTGDRIGIEGRVNVTLLSGGRRSPPVAFGTALANPGLDHTLVAVNRPLTLRIAPAPESRAALC